MFWARAVPRSAASSSRARPGSMASSSSASRATCTAANAAHCPRKPPDRRSSTIWSEARDPRAVAREQLGSSLSSRSSAQPCAPIGACRYMTVRPLRPLRSGMRSSRRWLRAAVRSRAPRRLRRTLAAYRGARRSLDAPVSRQSRRGLDWMNFFLADVQTGFGSFVAFYLADLGWSKAQVGLALTTGTLAGVVGQIPGGAFTDAFGWKRALAAAGIVMIAASALILALVPTFPLVFLAEILHGLTAGIVTHHRRDQPRPRRPAGDVDAHRPELPVRCRRQRAHRRHDGTGRRLFPQKRDLPGLRGAVRPGAVRAQPHPRRGDRLCARAQRRHRRAGQELPAHLRFGQEPHALHLRGLRFPVPIRRCFDAAHRRRESGSKQSRSAVAADVGADRRAADRGLAALAVGRLSFGALRPQAAADPRLRARDPARAAVCVLQRLSILVMGQLLDGISGATVT